MSNRGDILRELEKPSATYLRCDDDGRRYSFYFDFRSSVALKEVLMTDAGALSGGRKAVEG